MQRDEEPVPLQLVKKIIDSSCRNMKAGLKFIGDGSLIMFSALQAVRCAIALQKELREDPAIPSYGHPPGRRCWRMAISLAMRLIQLPDSNCGIAGSVLLSDRLPMKFVIIASSKQNIKIST
jgi:hypothetical protein